MQQDFINAYFTQSGLGWAMMGAAVVVALGCIGSARGIRIAAAQGAGLMSEKPELFGRFLVLMAMPGTQGFYALISAILIAMWTGLAEGNLIIPPLTGFAIFAVATGTGFVLMWSATFQGETSAACLNMVARQPDTAGRAIILPALVETYALVGLLSAIILLLFLTQDVARVGG
jgi:V/A-type H+/Na+-transporting ATPase subunit K